MSVISPGSSNKKGNQSNSPSKLLSQEENETLFRIMGARCQAQVSAVVQVFVTEPPNHSAWKKLHCGVATFTKDNSRRSYFIQVYDIIKEQKLLEQELYNLFAYYVSLPFFHQFEGENQMIGLNFADNQEAEGFGKVITDRLEAKQRKREEKRRQQQMEINTQQPPTPQPSHQRQTFSGQQNNIQHSYTNNSNISNKNRGRKGKKANKIRKDQIGEPTNFQHITHVGFDQDRGFSSFNANEELNEFFKMAGVSQNLLQDDNTRRFIYDFIDQHGGVERAAQETKVYGSIRRAPSVAEKAGPPPPPPPPNVDSTPQPPNKPALPSRNSNAGSNPPPPPPPRPHLNNHPHVAPPPPPPKDKNLAEKDVAPSAPATGSGSHSNAPPPPPPPRIPPAPGGGGGAPTPPRISNGEGAPVPPPPPPPPVTSSGGGGSNAPPMPSNAPPMPSNVPPMPSNAVVDSNTRNDLLAQIRQRPTLNPVSQLKIEKPEKDSRTTLMSEIRNREYELKPVIVQEGDASPGAPPVENSMAAMLARALEGRAKAMQDESDDEEDEEEDEDEWDDN